MKMLFALLSLLIVPCAWADAPLQSDLPLSYLEQAGNGKANQPLVIFLHGYGSNEEDLFAIKDDLPTGYTYLSVRAPLTLQPGAYEWFAPATEGGEYDGVKGNVADSEKRIVAFVAAAASKYHTQADKVTLVGFSQGAILSYEVALHYPQSVGAVAVLSGKLLPPLRASMKADPRYAHVRFFIGHGTADPVLPFAQATLAEEQLRAIGIAPQFHAYPGLKHSISEAEISDLRQWLQL